MKVTTLLILFILSFTAVQAQNWTGAIDSDWNNPANWSSQPLDGSTLLIDPVNYQGASAAPALAVASDFVPAGVVLQNGASFSITGELELTDYIQITDLNTLFFLTNGTLRVTGAQGNMTISEQAVVTMYGAALEVAKNLEVELGGKLTVSASSVVESNKVIVSGGQGMEFSDVYLSSGTITTDTLQFSNDTATFTPRFRMTDGELNIASNFSWLGSGTNAGRGYFKQSGGVVNLSGILGNATPGAMNIKLEVSAMTTFPSVFNNTVSAVYFAAGDSLLLHYDGRWEEGVAVVNWQNDGVFYSDEWGIYRPGISTLTGTGVYQFGNITIPIGRKLEHISPRDLLLCGDLDINGEFISHQNRVIVNSRYFSQNIDGPPGGQTFYDLQINNHGPLYTSSESCVRLYPDITIENSMELKDGIVLQYAPWKLHFADNATLTGGTDTTFIDATIRKTGNEAFTFALGKCSVPQTFMHRRYRPLTITAPTSASTVVEAAYRPVSPDITIANTPLQSISHMEYWPLSRTGSTDLFGVSVGWDDAAASGLSDCSEISLGVLNSDGTSWNAVSSTTSGLCSGDNAGMLTSIGNLPGISDVSIGFNTNTVHQEVVSVCNGGTHTVNGHVYDSSGVYIDELTAANGGDSTVITILTIRPYLMITVGYNPDHLVAAGEGLTFQWIDCGNGNAIIPGEAGPYFFPSHAGNYAVIAHDSVCNETDTSQCTEMLYAGISEQKPLDVKLYPNPVASSGQLILESATVVTALEINGLDGRVVESEVHPVSEDGKIVLQLPDLPGGMYLLTTSNAAGQLFVTRFMVED